MANYYWIGAFSGSWSYGLNWASDANGTPVEPGNYPGSAGPAVDDASFGITGLAFAELSNGGNGYRYRISKSYPTWASVTISLVAGAVAGWSNVGDAWTYTYTAGMPWAVLASVPGGAPFTVAGGYGDTSSTITALSTGFSSVTNSVPGNSIFTTSQLTVLSTQTSALTFTGAIDTYGFAVQSGAGAVTLNSDLTAWGITSASANALTVTGTTTMNPLSGGPTVTLNGAGNIALNGNLSTSDTYGFTFSGSGGGTASVGGFISVGGGAEIYATVNLQLGNAPGTSVTIGAGKTLTIGSGTQSGTYKGLGALRKNTSGVLTLLSGNTYAGGTTVDAGTVKAGATDAIPGPCTVNASGTLRTATDVNGSLMMTGKLTINGGTLRIGG